MDFPFNKPSIFWGVPAYVETQKICLKGSNYPWSIYIRRHIHVLDTYTLFHNDKVGRPLLHHRGSSVADELLHGDLVDDFLGQHVAEQADGRDAAAAWSMISSSKMIVKWALIVAYSVYTHIYIYIIRERETIVRIDEAMNELEDDSLGSKVVKNQN